MQKKKKKEGDKKNEEFGTIQKIKIEQNKIPGA